MIHLTFLPSPILERLLLFPKPSVYIQGKLKHLTHRHEVEIHCVCGRGCPVKRMVVELGSVEDPLYYLLFVGACKCRRGWFDIWSLDPIEAEAYKKGLVPQKNIVG